MTCQGSIVSKDCILDHWFARAHSLKEIPQMRLDLVPRKTAISDAFRGRLFTWRRIVLLMPFLEVFLPHGFWKARGIVAGREIDAQLGRIGQTVFTQLQNPF